MPNTPGPCFLCGNQQYHHRAQARDVEYFTTPEPFDFYECDHCRLLKIHPVPADRLSVIYPSNYYSFSNQKHSLVNDIKEWLDKRLFRKILNDLPGEKLNLLDVGGGSGWLLNVIRSISDRVSLTQVVDLDPDAAQVAEENGHRYFCGRIEDFETADRFDFVLLLNLIEHVADPLRVMNKIASLLTPGGVALIKTPNYDSLDARIYRNKNWGGYHCPRHWVLFNKESLGQLALKAGLRIRSFSYTQGAPFWAVSILAGWHKRGWIRLGADRPAFRHPMYPVLLGLFAGFDLLRKPFAKTSQMFVTVSKN